jgi:hypothetical protein
MKFIGLDAGSVSVKLVVLDEHGTRLYSHYERHKGHPLAVALALLGKITNDSPSAPPAMQTKKKTRRERPDGRSLLPGPQAV